MATGNVPDDYSRHIRELRARLGLSQQRLAALLGVASATVNRWEGGHTRPGLPLWQRFEEIETAGPAALPAPDSALTTSPPAAERPLPTVGPATGLPVYLTSFVGRGTDLAAVQRLLAGQRLVTVVGAGGAGKTRLAVETARTAAGAFAGAVYWVELAALAAPEQLTSTVARVLQTPTAGSDVLAALLTHIGRRRLLLVLDNCEHLIDACADLAVRLLRGCPALTILATSRESLRVDGERVWRLEPLPVDAGNDEPARTLPDPTAPAGAAMETAQLAPAIRLFLDRALARRAGIGSARGDLALIDRICRCLDGLPLALELAAARAGALALEDIAARLDDRFHVLVSTSRSTLPRHHTLETAIAWSYHLLSDLERHIFLQVSVFSGGFTLDAAVAVCSGSGTSVVIENLVEKSLLFFQDRSGGRYAMLESIRAFARAQLDESGPQPELRGRHARYFRGFVEPMAQQPGTGTWWLERVDADIENLRAALSWFEEGGDHQSALAVALDLFHYWRMRGLWREGRRWISASFARVALPPRGRGRALRALGVLMVDTGDHAAALPLLEESVHLATEIGDPRLLADAQMNVMLVYQALGRWQDAEQAGREGLAALEGLDEPFRRAGLLNNLGRNAFFLRDYVQGREHFQAVLTLGRSMGNVQTLLLGLTGCGATALALGRYEEASVLLEEALARVRATGADGLISLLLVLLAHVERRSGRPEQAVSYLHGVLRQGTPSMHNDVLVNTLVGAALLLATAAPALTVSMATALDTLPPPAALPLLPFLRDELDEQTTAARALLDPPSLQVAVVRGSAAEPAALIAEALQLLTHLRREEPAGAQVNPSLERTAAVRGQRSHQGLPVTAFPDPSGPPLPVLLSAREADVLQRLASGASTKEIARALAISVRTVERHLANLYAKLGARGRADAIVWAANHANAEGGTRSAQHETTPGGTV